MSNVDKSRNRDVSISFRGMEVTTKEIELIKIVISAEQDEKHETVAYLDYFITNREYSILIYQGTVVVV